MNDNDIIKALKCCEIEDCDECPFRTYTHCRHSLVCGVSDVINRQKAEIDRLNHIRAELSKDIEELQEKLNRSIGVDKTGDNWFPYD